MPPSTSGVKTIKTWQIILPVELGLFVVAWLLFDELNTTAFASFRFTFRSLVFIAGAMLLMVLRDMAMMTRFRIFTNNVLSWRQAFTVNVLSEFTSAITPTAVGGSSLAVFFLAKEGIAVGKGTVITLVSVMLDKLYFVVVFPILFILLPLHLLFPPSAGLISSIGYVFAVVFSIHLLWTILLFVSVFIYPYWATQILSALFRLPVLRRWRIRAENVSAHIVQASKDTQAYPVSFWLKTFALTVVAWTARFMVVNLLFFAWAPAANGLAIFARQLVVWVSMEALPTPGGSGASEWMFKEYYGDLIFQGSILIVITIIWRLLTYYAYLLLGVLVTPKWLRKPRKVNV